MDSSFSTSTCFFLTCNVSNCELKELRISILKFSNKLPILASGSSFQNDLVILVETSLGPFPCFEVPHEYLLHNSQI
jgi:hypothetical protein